MRDKVRERERDKLIREENKDKAGQAGRSNTRIELIKKNKLF